MLLHFFFTNFESAILAAAATSQLFSGQLVLTEIATSVPATTSHAPNYNEQSPKIRILYAHAQVYHHNDALSLCDLYIFLEVVAT